MKKGDFKDGEIQGVLIVELKRNEDERGWLIELFREDDGSALPPMSYVSMTLPGVMRGPHSHERQTDRFVFSGVSSFALHLWDGRKDSPTYMNKMSVHAPEGRPLSVSVPPGVVHAYKNTGRAGGIVINLPDRLYRGWGGKEEPDEIRHEDDPESIYKAEE